MHIISKGRGALIAAAMLTGPVATGLAAQEAPPADLSATITEPAPAEAAEGRRSRASSPRAAAARCRSPARMAPIMSSR